MKMFDSFESFCREDITAVGLMPTIHLNRLGLRTFEVSIDQRRRIREIDFDFDFFPLFGPVELEGGLSVLSRWTSPRKGS